MDYLLKQNIYYFIKMKPFSAIVLSGGIFKATSMIGVIKYLEEHKLVTPIKTLVGTSAGSVICFLLSLNYSWSEMRDLLINVSKNTKK